MLDDASLRWSGVCSLPDDCCGLVAELVACMAMERRLSGNGDGNGNGHRIPGWNGMNRLVLAVALHSRVSTRIPRPGSRIYTDR